MRALLFAFILLATSAHAQDSSGSSNEALLAQLTSQARATSSDSLIVEQNGAILTENYLVTKSQSYFAYGLLWWLYGPAGDSYSVFSAVGWGGQYITVFPEKHLIAIRTANPATMDPTQEPTLSFPSFPTLITQWQ